MTARSNLQLQLADLKAENRDLRERVQTMLLILKPKGRGNWASVDVTISGVRALPLLFQVGQTISMGGLVWRICRIHT